jgi:UDP-N-acetylglucosamine 2-epimerase
LSDQLFCITQQAVRNLVDEGIIEGVYYTGDVMLDALQQNVEVARDVSKISKRLNLSAQS